MFPLPPIPGLSLPGLTSLPSMSSSATSRLDTHGSINHASGDGDWIVNMGGSAPTLQTASSGSLLWVALALGVAWLLLKRLKPSPGRRRR